MVTIRKLMVLFSALGAITNCSMPPVYAQDAAPGGIATLYSKQGVVESRADGNAAWTEAAQGSPFQQSHAVRVGENGRAGIKFADGLLVRLGSKAFLEFSTPGGQPELNLAAGKGYFFNRAPGTRPTIKTPVVSAAIRGTEFAIEVGKDTSKITVIDGQVSAKNEFGEVTAGKGEQVSVKRGSAPVKEVVVDLQNQIQWALYYPSVSAADDLFNAQVLNRHKTLLEAGRSSKGTIPQCSGKSVVDRDICAVALADQGKVDEALALLAKDNSPIGNAIAAGLYLSVGQTETAEARIAEIESARAAGSEITSIAAAQRAIIALSKGDVAKARSFADRATQLSPNGSSSALSLAYVLQAQGDTPGAYRVLSDASEHHPHDAMLLARLAELELGLNHPTVARELVNRAKQANPNLAYARMVDGYLLLIEGRRESAVGAFHEVTENDPGLSSAQLGLGLAKIGTGDTAGGRAHVEQAVHLSPSTGSYRSYLGKAFFEEDNYDKARGEYDLAVKLDSEDPTPYLYRAFLSLAENDPVYALSDVLESVEKNDNRSVFRSRVLLDQDEAVRSASLARVYNDLGFVELGRIEAIKAISKDYTNYSAHRLLAGAYSQDLFTARAATNETLISNLLAPPSLNLFFSNGDKTTTGNYTALYDRNEQRSELTTENSTLQDSLGGSATSTGKFGSVGYGVRAAQTSAFGSKDGSYDRSTTASATVKWELAPEHQLTLSNEYLHQGKSLGATSPLNLAAGAYQDEKGENNSSRLGYYGKMSDEVSLLATSVYQYTRNNIGGLGTESVAVVIDDALTGRGVDTISTFGDVLSRGQQRAKNHILGGETQLLWNPEFALTVVGGSYFRRNERRYEATSLVDSLFSSTTDASGDPDFQLPDSFFFGNDYQLDSSSRNTFDDYRGYVYTTWHLTPWADLTTGASYVEEGVTVQGSGPFGDETALRRGWSPKVGLLVTPHETTTLRMAYYQDRYRFSDLLTERLEPNLVGGFNQVLSNMFAAANPVEVGAAAFDLKFNKKTFIGVEGQLLESKQVNASADPAFFFDYNEPSFSQGTIGPQSTASQGEIVPFDRDDLTRNGTLVGSYWSQVLARNLVSSVNYYRVDINQRQTGTNDPLQADIAVAGLRYFGPDFWYSSLNGTFRSIDQDAQSTNLDFWTFDTSIGYRFPHRQGGVEFGVRNIFDEREGQFSTSAPLDRGFQNPQHFFVQGSFNF